MPGISSLISVTHQEDDIEKSRIERKLVDLLIYGISGVGKTPFLASVKNIPEINNPVYLDLESGAHAAYEAGIEVIELRHFMSLAESQKNSKVKTESDGITELVRLIAKKLKENPDYTNCFLFDGWTEAYDIIHEQSKLDGSGDKEVGTQNDRMRALVRVKRLSRLIRSLPVHIISTAREYSFTSDTSSNSVTLLERGPHLSGAAMRYIAAQSDIVARLRIVGNKFVFSVREDSVTIARDRFHVLPDQIKMDKPSLTEIWEYIRGEKKR